MLQPSTGTLFVIHRLLHVQYVLRVISSARIHATVTKYRLWGLVDVSHRNPPCQRDLWSCVIIKLQLSADENPIPFLLILLMYWYISKAVSVFTLKYSKEPGFNVVCLNNVKDCWKRTAACFHSCLPDIILSRFIFCSHTHQGKSFQLQLLWKLDIKKMSSQYQSSILSTDVHTRTHRDTHRGTHT